MLFQGESKQLMFQRKANVETNVYADLEIFLSVYKIKLEYSTWGILK